MQGSLLWAACWSIGKAYETTPYSLVLLPDSTDAFHMLLLLMIASNPAVITHAINKTVLLYSCAMLMLIIYEVLLKLIKRRFRKLLLLFKTSNLIRQSDSLPKSPNIIPIIFSAYTVHTYQNTL